MARENTKYTSVNYTVDQYERFKKLADRCNMPMNALHRLVAERLQPSDVEAMLKRG